MIYFFLYLLVTCYTYAEFVKDYENWFTQIVDTLNMKIQQQGMAFLGGHDGDMIPS